MTANWRTLRNTLAWLLVAVMTLGIVIASPYVTKTDAASTKTTTVTVAKANNGTWGAVRNGKIDKSVTGVYKNAYGWWYVKDGLVQFDYNGIQKNQYGWWRIEKGKVNFNANSIYKNAYGWWKTTNGKVTFKETGVYKNDYGWWRVEKSKVNFKFNGLASNKYGLWYIKNGKVDFTSNGAYQYDGKYYIIKDGKATLISDENLEAVEVARQTIRHYPLSRARLIELLTDKDVGYSKEKAEYAADNAGIDYKTQAVLVAADLVEDEPDITRDVLEQTLGAPLSDNGYAFTAEEVAYAMQYYDKDQNK